MADANTRVFAAFPVVSAPVTLTVEYDARVSGDADAFAFFSVWWLHSVIGVDDKDGWTEGVMEDASLVLVAQHFLTGAGTRTTRWNLDPTFPRTFAFQAHAFARAGTPPVVCDPAVALLAACPALAPVSPIPLSGSLGFLVCGLSMLAAGDGLRRSARRRVRRQPASAVSTTAPDSRVL